MPDTTWKLGHVMRPSDDTCIYCGADLQDTGNCPNYTYARSTKGRPSVADTKMEHTPLPWRWRNAPKDTIEIECEPAPKSWREEARAPGIVAPIAYIQGSSYIAEAQANARLIVRAVNSYGPMLEALKGLVDHVRDYKAGKIWSIDYKGIQEQIDAAEAAIETAEGE